MQAPWRASSIWKSLKHPAVWAKENTCQKGWRLKRKIERAWVSQDPDRRTVKGSPYEKGSALKSLRVQHAVGQWK